MNLILKFLSASPSFKAYAHIYTLLLLKNKRIPFIFQDKIKLFYIRKTYVKRKLKCKLNIGCKAD